MFGKKRNGHLYAPANGRAIPLQEVPDPAFAEGMLGRGVAIEPCGGRFVSPCNGTVVGVADTLHAYNLLTDDGLELLLHIGIDTVALGGEGFRAAVKEGDRIGIGDLLAEVDLELVALRGYSTVTPLLIVNPECLAELSPSLGAVTAGSDKLLRYRIANERKECEL